MAMAIKIIMDAATTLAAALIKPLEEKVIPKVADISKSNIAEAILARIMVMNCNPQYLRS